MLVVVIGYSKHVGHNPLIKPPGEWWIMGVHPTLFKVLHKIYVGNRKLNQSTLHLFKCI